MKPIVTWVLLADAQSAHVVVNRGPGKGLSKAENLSWTAKTPVDYSDQAGRSFSSHGPGSSGMARRDPGKLAEADFAQDIARHMAAQCRKAAFDRLVLVAAPHMLGALRDALEPAVIARVTAEVDKDLTKLTLQDLPDHLAKVLAV